MKMRYLILLHVALLLTSCGWKSSARERDALINISALYDPPSVTLIEGKEYQFKEGVITGSGQKFHSHYRYMRAIAIGK